MYQDFATAADKSLGTVRIARLRTELARQGLDAFLVPRADEHMGEYVPPAAERLKWLTGFSGSAGMAIIGGSKAALFVDGRYTLQSRSQVDTTLLEIVQTPETEPADWIANQLPGGAVVGYDPWLHATAAVRRMSEVLATRSIRLKPVTRNPVDRIWGRDRPPPPAGAVVVQPLDLAGRAAEAKIADMQKVLKEAGEDAAILTLPDSIAWLLNIRGSDIAHNPTALAFAVLHAAGRPELFIDRRKLGPEVRAHLNAIVRLRAPEDLAGRIAALRQQGRRVRLDESTAAHWFRRALGERSRKVVDGRDPCILPKARKNDAEIRGARIAHERDGVAITRYLAWLDREAPSGRLDEIGAVRHLEALRAETQALREISFDTIAGSGPNGAIVHYRVTEASNRRLQKGELFLVDSGGQFQDGTTDITRTVAVGPPTREMKERFTLVLKGHIAIAALRFPKGTTGAHIDAFARRALWEAGLEFDHGTGHGVGSYLSVHEGPQSISKRGHVALEPGMLVSNEPGYYKAGAYGIRIENLVLVTEPATIEGGERPMMGFETLTLAPIDRRLVEPRLMSPSELAWLDAYHARVAKLIGPHLNAEDRAWLAAATAPLR
jgi:Xaa-Pro aminopeptidase